MTIKSKMKSNSVRRFLSRALVLPAVMSLLLTACNGSDCPLNNTVRSRYTFYSSESGVPAALSDTLTVSALPRDTVLINRAYNITSMSLPVGYLQMADTLLFRFSTQAGQICDTVIVNHTNVPHFESLDCGTAIFHEITGVSVTRRAPSADYPTAIDSIVVSNKKINYDENENFKVYLGSY